MKYSRRYICLSSLALFSPKTLACVLGFTFEFKRMPDETAFKTTTDSFEQFIDKKYGQGKWSSAEKSLHIFLPEILESSTVIPFVVGSDKVELAGIFDEIVIFSENYIYVLDGERFTHEYFPREYFIDENKNDSKAWNLHDISHEEKSIIEIARYRLGDTTPPYLSMRLDLSQASSSRVFAAFVPKHKNELVQIVRSEKKKIPTACTTTTYVKGAWPKDLKQHYKYE